MVIPLIYKFDLFLYKLYNHVALHSVHLNDQEAQELAIGTGNE